jgi:hypothetical protein
LEVRRGSCLGEETFRNERLAQMSEQLGAEHYGEERAETEAAKAERIIAEELKRRKWEASELRARAKGAPEKVALAARLQAETMMTVVWIAERLGMGTRGSSEPPAVSAEEVLRAPTGVRRKGKCQARVPDFNRAGSDS